MKFLSFVQSLLVATVVLAVLLFVPIVASATSVDDAATVRAGFSVNGIYTDSYDVEAEFNAFTPYAGITGADALQIGSFSGGAFGNQLQVTLLNEFAFFDGNHGIGGNNFGVVDQNGNFISIIDSAVANAGYTNSITQNASDSYTFALRSANHDQFSAIDTQNADNKSAHLVAQRVEKDADITINFTDLDGVASPFTFHFLAGDYILYMEDLAAVGLNPLIGGRPWDFDYNDMVVVVHASQLPEPSTMLLMTAGLAGLGVSRRRKAHRA